jgi:hypothetical protein
VRDGRELTVNDTRRKRLLERGKSPYKSAGRFIGHFASEQYGDFVATQSALATLNSLARALLFHA